MVLIDSFAMRRSHAENSLGCILDSFCLTLTFVGVFYCSISDETTGLCA